MTTSGRENGDFWNDLSDKLTDRRVDLLLGDLNMVEEANDRFPPHNDALYATEAFSALKIAKGLIDGWRLTNPALERNYTYGHIHGSPLSRIDGIYASEQITERSLRWNIVNPNLPTGDHQMVTMELHNDEAPELGRGRWAIPIHLINNKRFLEETENLGKKALESIVANKPPNNNPQLTFHKFTM